MIAEELFFGESGTGPGCDLDARDDRRRADGRLVRHGGLARQSSRRSTAARSTQGIVGKVLANDEFAGRVERLLDQAKEFVRELLDDNRHLVEALRDELLAREELVGDEITEVIAEAQMAKVLADGGQ